MSNVDMSAKYGETTLSNFEVFMMGEAFYTWIATTVRLGHASPGMSLDYTTDAAGLGLSGLIMRDFVAWTSGRTHLVDGCEERLRELTESADVDVEMAARVDVAMGVA